MSQDPMQTSDELRPSEASLTVLASSKTTGDYCHPAVFAENLMMAFLFPFEGGLWIKEHAHAQGFLCMQSIIAALCTTELKSGVRTSLDWQLLTSVLQTAAGWDCMQTMPCACRRLLCQSCCQPEKSIIIVWHFRDGSIRSVSCHHEARGLLCLPQEAEAAHAHMLDPVIGPSYCMAGGSVPGNDERV